MLVLTGRQKGLGVPPEDIVLRDCAQSFGSVLRTDTERSFTVGDWESKSRHFPNLFGLCKFRVLITRAAHSCNLDYP